MEIGYKMKTDYKFKLERAKRYFNTKHMQKNFNSGKVWGGGA